MTNQLSRTLLTMLFLAMSLLVIADHNSPAALAQDAATPLTYGETLTGSLDDTQTAQLYIFSGTAGDTISVTMNATSGDLDTALEVYTSDGVLLRANDDGGENTNARLSVTLPTSGDYNLFATSYAGAGDYELTLTLTIAADDAAPQSVEYGGTPVEGVLSDEAFQMRYQFTGTDGDQAIIVMDANPAAAEGVDCLLYVYDPDGNLLAWNDDHYFTYGLNALVNVELPADGEYVIIATRFGEQYGATTGAFTLSILTETPAYMPTSGSLRSRGIEYNETVDGTLDDSSFAVIWHFEGTAGDEIAVDIQTISGDLDTVLVLIGPDGYELAYNDDTDRSFDARIALVLPYTGEYQIVAMRYQSSEGTTSGDYELTLTGPVDPEAETEESA